MTYTSFKVKLYKFTHLGMIKTILSNKNIPNYKELEKSLDSLFQNKDKTFTQILDFFYRKEANVLIFQQLLLIAQNLNFNEENENRDFCSFLKKFIGDINLDFKLVNRDGKNNMVMIDDDEDMGKLDNLDDEEDKESNDFLSKL